MDDGLDERERAFACYLFEGRSGREAFRLAFPEKVCSDGAARVAAHRLLRKPALREYLSGLDGRMDKRAILTRQQRMEFLSRIVTTPISLVDDASDLCQEVAVTGGATRFKMPGKLDAIKELNRMDGAYEAERKGDGQGESLDELVRRALCRIGFEVVPRDRMEVGDA